MSVNVRVEVRQVGNPELALKWALHRLRKDVSPVMREVRQREFFVSKARKRREKLRQAIQRNSLN